MTSETDKSSSREKKKGSGHFWWSAVFIGAFVIIMGIMAWLAYGLEYIPNGEENAVEVAKHISNHDLLGLGGHGGLWLGILLVIAVVIYIILKATGRGGRYWKVVDQNIKWCFLVVWILGFLTYCVGTYVGNPEFPQGLFNFLSVVPMAIIHATEMFIGASDISAIHQAQHENVYFMFFFNISHFLAITCSMLFVLLQFGFFMESQIRLWFRSFRKVKGNLFIFWGLNERSLILADSITEKIRKAEDERGSMVVFVRSYDDADSHSSNISFSRLFNMVKFKSNEIEKLRSMGCHVITAFHRLAKAKVKMDKGDEVVSDILGDQLYLRSLKRLVKKTKGKVHFFLLGDDDDNNINCARRIIFDETLDDPDKNTTVYCHSRRNLTTKVEEDYLFKNNIEVRLLDTSELAANSLKDNVDYHPLSFVDVNVKDNPGTVSKPFHALLVGFGETGSDVFRFLYEACAFLDRSSTPENTKRSKFVCDVVDERLHKLLPQFEDGVPAFFKPNGAEKKPENCDGKLLAKNCNSMRFVDEILNENNLEDLNYVVISLGNDDEGLRLALRILERTAMVRDTLNRFRVFLRVFDSDHAREIEHVLRHYNKLYRTDANQDDIIVTFGAPEELFTYDRIVNNLHRRNGAVFYYYYEKLSQKMKEDPENALELLKAEIREKGINYQ